MRVYVSTSVSRFFSWTQILSFAGLLGLEQEEGGTRFGLEVVYEANTVYKGLFEPSSSTDKDEMCHEEKLLGKNTG